MTHQKVNGFSLIAVLLLTIYVSSVAAQGDMITLRAEAFGVKADGVIDDGPALERLLSAAAKTAAPTLLQFPANRVIRVTSAPERYALRLTQASAITIDGGGSTFLLGPDVRFLRLAHSKNITIRNLNVDFQPLPFVDGTVVAVDARERYIDVQVPDGATTRLIGGPTKEDGEQAFFGMLWHEGAYGLLSRHYWIERTELAASPNRVRVRCSDRFDDFLGIEPQLWRISLPVPGIAHRYGPGACFDIHDNDTVTVENVELWSAPWFGFEVMRNSGQVVFRQVHIRPRPGTERLTSTWRDGFHVKGNSASLLWEDCILSGMNDDAFNLSTHCSRVSTILSPTEMVVQQTFPLNPMPWHPGATLMAADFDARIRLGTASIVRVTDSPQQRMIGDKPAASPVTLTLDDAITGLTPGAMVWEPQFANPDTTLLRCTIDMSCRFQTPVTLDSCHATALLWFYGERVEGPFPNRVTLSNCTVRRGRGNLRLAVSLAGRALGNQGPSVIDTVTLRNNQIWGDFSMIGVEHATLEGNAFREQAATIRVQGCPDLMASGNQDSANQPLTLDRSDE